MENNVRGTLVTGLTAKDMGYLDIFEGSVCSIVSWLFILLILLNNSNILANESRYTLWDHPWDFRII